MLNEGPLSASALQRAQDGGGLSPCHRTAAGSSPASLFSGVHSPRAPLFSPSRCPAPFFCVAHVVCPQTCWVRRQRMVGARGSREPLSATALRRSLRGPLCTSGAQHAGEGRGRRVQGPSSGEPGLPVFRLPGLRLSWEGRREDFVEGGPHEVSSRSSVCRCRGRATRAALPVPPGGIRRPSFQSPVGSRAQFCPLGP